MRKLKAILLGVSMAANQLVNAITGGSPQMSVSARAGYARAHGSKGGAAVCRVLEAIDFHPYSNEQGKDHCDFAIENYEGRVEKAKEKLDEAQSVARPNGGR